MPPLVCVFDVNETLLDLGALDPHFKRIFGDAAVRREWFAQLLQSALVSIVVDSYKDFATIGGAALEMVAARRGVKLAAHERSNVLDTMRHLPPHQDVPDALRRLQEAGCRLATLTNSPPDVARDQIEHAGLRPYFEQLLSAGEVHRLKPAPAPYRMAAERLGVSMGGMRLIAAHAWDVAGALHAGAAAAFVARPGAVLDPLFPRPDIVGDDLTQVANRIIELNALSVD